MREIEAQGQVLPVNQQVQDFSPVLSEAVPRLLDGLDRLRPELGTLADELISLLGGEALLATDVQQGTQDS